MSNGTGGQKKDVKSAYCLSVGSHTSLVAFPAPVGFPSVCTCVSPQSLMNYESVLCDWKMTTLIACKQSAEAEGFLIMH